MEKNHLTKIKFLTIIIFLVIGSMLLLFDNKKENNISSHHVKDTTITVIDLTEKSNEFNIPRILGILLISIAVLLTLQTYLLNPPTKPNIRSQITKQEKKVISLIELGKSNKEIAIELSISTSTVKTHINNIFKKVGVSSRDELLQNI